MCHAWELRTRFVERVGNVDSLISSPHSIPSDAPTRIRFQIGVFDDDAGPAPAAGVLGWNFGTLSITGMQDPLRAGARRTPGRLAPFTFAPGPNANGNPPLPDGDPFSTLTDIDNNIGIQSPLWLCDANGQPTPQPQPIVRGLNSFVSFYEITLTPLDDALEFQLNASGRLIAAVLWDTFGTPIPPDCEDPGNPLPGQVTYIALQAAPRPLFDTTITFVSHAVPAPGIGAGMLVGALMAARRRRP